MKLKFKNLIPGKLYKFNPNSIIKNDNFVYYTQSSDEQIYFNLMYKNSSQIFLYLESTIIFLNSFRLNKDYVHKFILNDKIIWMRSDTRRTLILVNPLNE